MSTSSEFAQMGDEMLTDEGLPFVLTRTTDGDYDPATGVTQTTETFNGRGARFGYKASEVDGSVILMGDAKVYISVYQVDGTAMAKPMPGDTITFAGSVLRVINCETYSHVGIDELYIAQCREG